MADVYGFRERQTAERLRDFAGQLANDRKGTVLPPVRERGGHLRTYWIVPKDTIPAATNEKTPGIGIGYICFLNRDADPPAIERFKDGEDDVEVEVFNYTPVPISETDNQLKPLIRVSEDVFGDLAIASEIHFRFTLLEDLSGGSAAATLTFMDGSNEFEAEVLDPIGMFDLLDAGSRGICFNQGCFYYIIQAECPEDVIPSSSTGGPVEPEPEPS